MRKALRVLSVRAKLILSFAAIVFASTFVFNITYSAVVEKNYIDQIDQNHQHALNLLTTNLETQCLEPAVIYASEMAINGTTFSDLHALIYKPEEVTPVDIHHVYTTLRGFSYHDMGLFSDVMFYSSDLNMTIANTNGVVYMNRADRKNPGTLWWVEAIQPGSRQAVWVYGNINPSLEQAGLIYIYSFPSPVSGLRNAFAFQLSAAALEDFMKSQKNPETAYFLFAPDMRLLHGDARALAAFPDQALLEAFLRNEEAENGLTKLQKGDVILNKAFINIAGLTLLAVTPTNLVYRQANALSLMLRGIGLLTLAAGLLLSYFLTNRLYHPLKAIRSAAPAAAGAEADALNEYEYIDAVLKKLDARASQLEQTLQENLPVLRDAGLRALLGKEPQEGGISLAQYQRIGLSLDMPYFRVMRVILPQRLIEALPRKDVEPILLSFAKMMDGLSDERQYGLYSIQNHPQGFSVLVNQQAGGIDGIMRLRHLADAVFSYGVDAFTIRVTCLISSVVRNPSLLYQLSAELEEIQAYHFFLRESSCLFAEDIPALTGGTEEVPAPLFASIRQQLEAGTARATAAAFESLLKEFQSGRYHHELCHQTILMVLQWAADRFPGQTLLFQELHEAYLRCENASGLVGEVLRVLQPRMTEADAAPPSRGHLLAQKAAAYIRKSVHEGITVEEIAAHFQVSAGYLGRLFREELGVTPSEYINAQRLEKSVLLLENTDKNIEEIAGEVGFGSTAYYIRKFREHFGITPKSHRLAFRQKEREQR